MPYTTVRIADPAARLPARIPSAVGHPFKIINRRSFTDRTRTPQRSEYSADGARRRLLSTVCSPSGKLGEMRYVLLLYLDPEIAS